LNKMECSKWVLLNRYYTAKKAYYGMGKSGLTDQEFDALERSIAGIHGEAILAKWGCVGYDIDKHTYVKAKFKKVMNYLKKETRNYAKTHKSGS